MILSLLFFVATITLLGLGVVLLATGRLRQDLETHVMCSGVGLAAFAVLAVLLNTLHVPLTWWTFLLSALVLAALGVARCRRLARPAEDAPAAQTAAAPFWTGGPLCLAAATALAAVSFAFFLHGTFSVPWLTDDDSWEHAASAKYIAIHHTYSIDPEARNYPHQSYLEPYPPGYPVLMGVLHQLSASIYRTLKLFNVLIVALGLVYFYVMAKEWTGSPSRALWMTGVLWIVPCFMSHFIWAQSMALVLFFPGFYAMERTRRDGAWAVVAAVVIAGVLLTQPSAAAVFGLMAGIFWAAGLGFRVFRGREHFSGRALGYLAAAAVAGVLIAALFYVPAYSKFGRDGFLWGIARKPPHREMTLRVTGTSYDKCYTLWDFMWAAINTKINQPTGIGLVLSVVLAAGVVLFAARPRRLDRWKITALAWLVLTVIGIQGNALPVNLFPHRFWAFFAIPLALIAGEFLAFLVETLDGKDTWLSAALGLCLGCAFVFVGVGESIYNLPQVALRGMRLWLLLAALAGGAAALVVGIRRLARSHVTTGVCVRFFVSAVLVCGVVLTSGYPKAWFEGFGQWPPGVFFYTGRSVTPAGEPTPVMQHLEGYVGIRRYFPPNARTLALTCVEDHPVGFDMLAPPYDPDVRRLRDDLEGMSPDEVDDRLLTRIEQLAHEKRLPFVLVDPYWAANAQFHIHAWHRRLAAMLRQKGMSAAQTGVRLDELLKYGATPTADERTYVESMVRQQGVERQVMEKLRRLRRIMTASGRFKPLLDSGPYGVAVFQMTTAARTPGP